eukprot:scpid83854/ scgid33473/ 
MLTAEQKHRRVDRYTERSSFRSLQLLQQFQESPDSFELFLGDWCLRMKHGSTPSILKRHIKARSGNRCELTNSEKFKARPPAGKMMATVFGDCCGVVMLAVISSEPGRTIDGQYPAC